MLWIAGEHINAGASVVIDHRDGKAYAAGERAGDLIGNAAEELREGFKVRVDVRARVWEDDA